MAERAEILILQGGAWGDRRQRPLFTYALPPALRDAIVPGQAVLVPFGDRLVTGICWQVDPPASDDPSREMREIAAIVDARPLLDATHLALAEWLAEAYVCSLVDAVRVIAPGLTAAPQVTLIAQGDPSGEAPIAMQGDDLTTRALVGLLHQAGRIDEQVVRRALGHRRAGALIAALAERGALARAVTPTVSRPAALAENVRLCDDRDRIGAWRTHTLGRIAAPVPAARRSSQGIRPRRRSGDFLRAIASAGTQPAPMRFAAMPSREAARLRGALAIVDLLLASPHDAFPRREALRLARTTPAALDLLVEAELVQIVPAPDAPHSEPSSAPLALNEAQQAALDHIVAAMDAAADAAALEAEGMTPDTEIQRARRPVLLHGVTGSGKTEVYLQALAAAVARGKRGLMLVPEIALTPQTLSRFAARFPERVALLHSALRPAERRRQWQRIRAGEVDVVVGSRSAIFAPLPDIGLIVLDEEHDASYKESQRAPTYHAREVAWALGRLAGAAVIMGSATPATESYFRAQTGEYVLLELPERAAPADRAPASLPNVTIVDLRAELHDGHTSILSRELLAAMEATLARREQVILYLNRRGMATCVLCRDCGFVARCVRCDVPLTHHHDQDAIVCHHCSWREPPPRRCPRCGGDGIRFFGVGTERVEATVRERFPRARVVRWDADTVRDHTDHERFAGLLADGQADILIGTQMVAKGIDVPGVTLVGIIAADVALYLPDYRASERAFQLLTQVAGRAGRGEIPGRVIMQTFSPDHFVIEAAARHDYRAFYDVEIAARQSYGYPPFRRFVKLTYADKDRHACQIEALSLGDQVSALIADLGLADTDIVGPAPAFIERLRDRYRWQMILRGPDPRALLLALGPGEPGPGWSVDVDPLSSL
jgi:primosomal protein N' (replication factor Y)